MASVTAPRLVLALTLMVGGCTGDNPSFGPEDEKGSTGSDETTSDSASSQGSASGMGTSGTTTGPGTASAATSTTGPGTDSGPASTGNEFETEGVEVCPADDGLLLPGVFTEGYAAPIFPDTAVTTYTGEVLSFDSGTIHMLECGSCDCVDGDVVVILELGVQPEFVDLLTVDQCVSVAMVATEDLSAHVGFGVFPPGAMNNPPVFAGFDSLSVPTFAANVVDVPVELVDVWECGEIKDDCAEALIPGHFALTFAGSEPVYPTESTARRMFGNSEYVFHNRRALYATDGICGPHFSWTMEEARP